MISSSLALPLVAVATLATIVFIGLGFLVRPSRATATWAAAFAVTMVGSYVWIAQEYAFPDELRAIGSGLVIGPLPLLWSGLRSHRSARSFVALSAGFLVLMPLILFGSTLIGVYGIVFRVMYAACAVFAVLLAVELMRLDRALRIDALPLLVCTALLLVAIVIASINGVLVAASQAAPVDALQLIRTMNLLGTPVFVVCALITLLLVTRRTGSSAALPRTAFEHTVRERLRRAAATGDEWWSVLDIRLDDVDDIRSAFSTTEFTAVGRSFADDVDAALPADADIAWASPTRAVVLIPRTQGGVREVLTELLERIARGDGHALPIRLSASVGWSPVTTVGYDVDALLSAADRAAQTAQAEGGDRWERVLHAPQAP